MRKDLESWMRGEMTRNAEAVFNVIDLQRPIAVPPAEPEEPPEIENVTGEVPLNEIFDEEPHQEIPRVTEITEERIEIAEKFTVDDPEAVNLETVKSTITTNYESGEDEYHEDHGGDKKRPAWELLEEAGSRIAVRLSNMRSARRGSPMYERGGFRKSRRRFFTLCVVAIIIAGTAVALYRNMQRGSYSAMMDMARGLYVQEQYAVAFEAYRDTALRHPGRIEPFLGMAHSAERIGRVDDAISAYRLSLELFPADALHSRSNVFYQIGRLYAMLKAWEEAQESFEEAIAADVANFSAHFSLGNSLEEQDQPDKALLAYQQALSLSPSSDVAREAVRRVSLVLASREEIALVERRFEQAFISGNAALLEERFREASDYFADALAIRSDDASAWVGFAEARAKLGDWAGEIRSLERALERDPENERAKSRLAEIEAQRRRDSSQRQDSPRSTPRSRNNPPVPEVFLSAMNREALFDSGVELYRKGEYAKAFDAFVASLRSSGGFLPSVSLAGPPGPVWRGFQVRLNVPSDIRMLAEAVYLNPMDRDLYVNLALAGTKMGIGREAMRSTLNEALSHARRQTGNR